MRLRWPWPHLRLRTRLAATMLLALFAIQAMDALTLYLLFPRTVRIYSAHWLIGTVENVALTVFQADAKTREAVAAALGADNRLHIHWRPQKDGPKPAKFLRPNLERVRATVESDLRGKAQKVVLGGVIGSIGTEVRIDVRYQPPGFERQMALGALDAGEKDFPVLGPFVLALQGLDGSWVTVGPEETSSRDSHAGLGYHADRRSRNGFSFVELHGQ